jgi:hypothetical protein
MKRFLLAMIVGAFLLCGFSPVNGGEVIFEWDANSESNLAGYRMYQTDTPGQYTFGVEHAIGVIPAGTETFTHVMAVDGTFFWVATAYDTEGRESGPSNEVTATVAFGPGPAAPTGCVVRIPVD